MQSSWSLVSTWLLHFLPFLSFSTQLSLPWHSRLSCSRSRTGSHIRVDHRPHSMHRMSLRFNHNQVPGTANLGDAWISVILSIGGLLPWLGNGKDLEPLKRPRHGNLKFKDWTISSIDRQFFLDRLYISSMTYGVCENGAARVCQTLIQLMSVLYQIPILKGRNVQLPPILALTTAIIPSLDNLPFKLVPTAMVLQDQQVEPTRKVEDTIIEPKTGFKFPLFLSFDELQDDGLSSGLQELAGVGVRTVTLIKLKSIKIYAFGFYIRPDCLRAKLGKKYNNVSSAELKHESSFYDDLLRHELEMTIRLVVHYKGLKMTTVRSAFETSLKNRLRKIKGVDEDEGLHMFCSYFKEGLSLSQGTVIDFQRRPGGQLLTQIDGCVVGTIASHDFCRAFFDLYIGDPPVSLKTKQEIGEKLGDMLRMN